MRPQSLVEAALLDQERRIIAASPREFGRAPAAISKGSIKCIGGCGRGRSPSNTPLDGIYICHACRVARRSALQPDVIISSPAPAAVLPGKCDECRGPCSESKDFCDGCTERLQLVRVELRSYGWTASREPIHPDDLIAR